MCLRPVSIIYQIFFAYFLNATVYKRHIDEDKIIGVLLKYFPSAFLQNLDTA